MPAYLKWEICFDITVAVQKIEIISERTLEILKDPDMCRITTIIMVVSV